MNEQIFCKCGCGELINKFDSKGKERIFKYRHQSKGQIPWNLGKSYSKERKKKMSKITKSGGFGFTKGYVPWNKGRKCPSISNSKKGKFGKNSCNWRGGITSLSNLIRGSDKYFNWRTQIFGRDNFTCQECGVRGTWLEAHHKKRFSLIIQENNIKTIEEALSCLELWDIDNGITLCKNCHEKTNNYKGKK